MPDDMEQAEALRRLSDSVIELRAELLVTQAALAAAMAELARVNPEPSAHLGDAVARLLGFAEAAAVGLGHQPGLRAQAPTSAALRIADWAEGILAARR